MLSGKEGVEEGTLWSLYAAARAPNLHATIEGDGFIRIPDKYVKRLGEKKQVRKTSMKDEESLPPHGGNQNAREKCFMNMDRKESVKEGEPK